MKEFSKNMLIVVASHDLLRLEKYADCEISLNDGHAVFSSIETVEVAKTTKQTREGKRVLSLAMAFSFVRNMFKKNAFRLILSLFANVAMLLVIAFSFGLMFVDQNRVSLSGQMSTGSPYYLLYSGSVNAYSPPVCEQEIEDMLIGEGYYRFTFINNHGISEPGPYNCTYKEWYNFYEKSFMKGYGIELYENSTVEELGLPFNKDVSKNIEQHLPESYEEIAITSPLADYLIECSKHPSPGGLSKQYENYDDLLENGRCYSRRICAILDTPDVSILPCISCDNDSSAISSLSYTIAQSVFLKNGYHDYLMTLSSEYVDYSLYEKPSYFLGKMTKGVSETLLDINRLSKKAGIKLNVCNYYTPESFTASVFRIDGEYGDEVGHTLLVIDAVIALADMAIITSLFFAMTKNDEVSLGILRGMGLKRKGIIGIVALSGLFLFALQTLLFLAFYEIVALILNFMICPAVAFFPYASVFNLVTIGTLLLISSFAVLVGSRKALLSRPLPVIRGY